MSSLIEPTTPQQALMAARQGRAGGRRHRVRTALVLTAAVSTALVGVAAPARADGGSGGQHEDHAFTQRNLVSDLPNLAEETDENLKNPWGIDFGPQTPLWVANQASNTSTLYRGATPAEPGVTILPLVVKADSPTGLVFNPTKKFVIDQGGKTAPANFLFNENLFPDENSATGEISGWSNASAPPPPTDTVVKVKKENSVYLGLALLPATHKRGPRLLAADGFGRIAVYDGRFRPRRQSGRAFVDPNAAKDKMTPYNVAYLKGRVYVAYTPSEEGGKNAISVFTKEGKFKKRLITDGPLAGPWGMVVAPKHWGGFGGALLVGNVDDGKINAFHRRSGRFLGTLENDKGEPLVNLGLWGLKFGNGVFGTPNDLIFAAGIGDELENPFVEVYEHGLLGIITPNDDDDDDHHGGS